VYSVLLIFLVKVVGGFFLFLIGSGYYRYREKSRQRTTCYRVFSSVNTLNQLSGSTQRCFAAEKSLLFFKGAVSYKFFFYRRKYRGSKGLSIDTTHTLPPPPPPWSFYSTFKAYSKREVPGF
jgi:hypothetical protein